MRLTKGVPNLQRLAQRGPSSLRFTVALPHLPTSFASNCSPSPHFGVARSNLRNQATQTQKRNLSSARSLAAQPAYSTPPPTARPTQVPVDNISYTIGPNHPPLDERTLASFWNETVAKYPDSPALVSRWEREDHHVEGKGEIGLRWSYKEMDEHVEALAKGLLKMGLKKGDRIGVFLGNGSAYAALQWATAKVGIILACINPAAKGPELLNALNLTTCSALFISPTIKRVDLTEMLFELFPSLKSNHEIGQISEPACPSLKSIVMVDNTVDGRDKFEEKLQELSLPGLDFRQLLVWDKKPLKSEKLDNHEIINLQFTSGTTGLPKAVSLTHRNLLNNGFHIGNLMKLRPPAPGWAGERLANVPPLFHCFGIVLGNMAVWTHGGCIIYPAETFDPTKTLRTVVEEKCTALHGVPTMFVAELALLDMIESGYDVPGLSDLAPLDFSSLRTGIAAGSPVPDETMRKLMKRMNMTELVITYGQTETSPATVMSSTDDPVDLRCTTVGQVMPHARVRVVNPADPLYPSPETPSLPIGVPGELWSAGYAVCHGYWNNAAETEKSIFMDEEGVRWMRTGDEAIMNKDGYVSIVGRIKDIIIRGGENIFPVVVENRALLLSGVADCSVIAVPCPRMGEAVGAFVQREDSAAGRALTKEQISEHVHKLLSHQSRPEWVWWLGEDGVATEYPKTASGKIRKVELRKWAKELQQEGIGKVDLPPRASK
ncbi:acetyl-CoA synthetase-like protein [Meredithblackwellia eburnea MCA 4105]